MARVQENNCPPLIPEVLELGIVYHIGVQVGVQDSFVRVLPGHAAPFTTEATGPDLRRRQRQHVTQAEALWDASGQPCSMLFDRRQPEAGLDAAAPQGSNNFQTRARLH